VVKIKEKARYRVRDISGNEPGTHILSRPGFDGYASGRAVTVENVGLSHVWFTFQDGTRNSLFKSEFGAIFELVEEAPSEPAKSKRR
jgi:hypothetical protein